MSLIERKTALWWSIFVLAKIFLLSVCSYVFVWFCVLLFIFLFFFFMFLSLFIVITFSCWPLFTRNVALCKI
jgi:hypothetical protein